jgi:hypothetical protein
MTKREAAIVTAYTGIKIGEFHEAHKYIEEVLQRPVFIHELARKEITDKIHEKSRQDFLSIKVE